MRVFIRQKRTKDMKTNVIRDFQHTVSYSYDKNNNVLEVTNEDTNYKVIYPLGCSEYITIQPDEDNDV